MFLIIVGYVSTPRLVRGDQSDSSYSHVVPKSLRRQVMQLAHDSLIGGHLVVKKTTSRILNGFYSARDSGRHITVLSIL